MNFLVKAADLTALRISEPDTVTSVLQNIAIILTTRKGTVPLCRAFGLSHEFLDKPTPCCQNDAARVEIREAIERWEPRARFAWRTFEEDVLQPGRSVPTVEVEIYDE